MKDWVWMYWVWMPHSAHLIIGNQCRFHLATKIGEYLISTVGEYWPDEAVREIHAVGAGIKLVGTGDERAADFLNKCGYMEVGANRIYETMVFPAKPSGLTCCPWTAANWSEIESNGYNDPGDAYEGHLAMCRRYDSTD